MKYIKRATRFLLDTKRTISYVYKIDKIAKKMSLSEKTKNTMLKELLQSWGKKCTKSAKIELEIHPKMKDIKGNFILMPNHSSNMDIPLVLYTCNHSLRFIAKKSLFKFPYLGRVLKNLEMFEIDRNNLKKAIKTIDHASEKLKNGLNSVVIFPEGTRSKDGMLKKFKKGGFHMAIDSGCPIVPVTIIGANKINAVGDWKIKDGNVKIIYHEPIDSSKYSKKDLDKLINITRKMIEKDLNAR